jgi:hypothetical protein
VTHFVVMISVPATARVASVTVTSNFPPTVDVDAHSGASGASGATRVAVG